tara:strand:- start:115 stop:948 length:834 start_codon:yes stop_codon:yes gene_type:complete
MKNIYDKLSSDISIRVMYEYSTSFYWSTYLLDKKTKKAICAVYAFVRLADEIVDSFHQYNKNELLNDFINDFEKSIDNKISLNPIFNSFQKVYHEYNFENDLVYSFLDSMKSDINKFKYTSKKFDDYIYGSAEVVGLMCLKIFVNGDQDKYNNLKKYALKLGSAFQKVNFLRDINYDKKVLNRNYFSFISDDNINNKTKDIIIKDIKKDFNIALIGIKKLDKNVQFGVYTAYLLYKDLLNKIENKDASDLFKERISVFSLRKLFLIFKSALKINYKF